MMMNISTTRRIEYACGYIELGLLVEASDELEAISSGDQLSPNVLEVWMRIHMARGQWDLVVATARTVTNAKPSHEHAWILLGYAARRLVGIETAEAILLKGVKRVGIRCAVIHFNLACYRCVLGDVDGAKDRLSLAFGIDPAMRAMAMTDEDLKPMRTAIAAMP